MKIALMYIRVQAALESMAGQSGSSVETGLRGKAADGNLSGSTCCRPGVMAKPKGSRDLNDRVWAQDEGIDAGVGQNAGRTVVEWAAANIESQLRLETGERLPRGNPVARRTMKLVMTTW